MTVLGTYSKKVTNLRHKRKLQHIALALTQQGLSNTTGFSKIQLIHNCLTEYGFHDVNLKTTLFNKSIDSPIIINAITGGPPLATSVNIKLAQISKHFNIPMAVGSQTIAIKEPHYRAGFKALRKVNPKGILMANISAKSSIERAKIALEMIEADALQLHLNPAQEIMMEEGDRSFKGTLENIQRLVSELHIPVVIKEVGCGISFEAAQKLANIGVKYMDTGGYGGTNFTEIEGQRKKYLPLDKSIYSWGIPTAQCILEVGKIPNIKIIAGGGITTPLDTVKAYSIGASYVSMAGFFLKLVHHNDLKTCIKIIEKFIHETKILIALQGVNTPEALKGVRKEIKA